MKHIYFNGKVYTGSLPLAEAFAVENGKFIFAGSSKSVLKLAGEGDVCTDLKGRFVCSGFNDSHMHLLDTETACVLPGWLPVQRAWRICFSA